MCSAKCVLFINEGILISLMLSVVKCLLVLFQRAPDPSLAFLA